MLFVIKVYDLLFCRTFFEITRPSNRRKRESQPPRLHVGEQLHSVISHLLYHPVLYRLRPDAQTAVAHRYDC